MTKKRYYIATNKMGDFFLIVNKYTRKTNELFAIDMDGFLDLYDYTDLMRHSENITDLYTNATRILSFLVENGLEDDEFIKVSYDFIDDVLLLAKCEVL